MRNLRSVVTAAAVVTATLIGGGVAEAVPPSESNTFAVVGVAEHAQANLAIDAAPRIEIAGPARAAQISPSNSTIQASYTFSREDTERIYTAARNSGIAGVTALCVIIAPGWVKAIGCPIFAQVVASFIPSDPPEGRCLQVFTRWGWPPIGVRYVEC